MPIFHTANWNARAAPRQPAGTAIDIARLGHGLETFARAREAVLAWSMFRLGWVVAHPTAPVLAPGANVAVLVRACCAWWLNGARIVYVHDSTIDDRQSGFAYGTLDDHAERGEERFWVVRDQDDQVWFELTAMSHPAKWFVRAGLPLVRRLQRRFAADAQAAMQRAVGGAYVRPTEACIRSSR